MKNDPTFKFLAIAIIAGVIVSFVSPAHHAESAPHPTSATRVVPAGSHSSDTSATE